MVKSSSNINNKQYNNRIKKIVIVGGGTAGWMAASALAKMLGSDFSHICLIESDDIGTIGVGEATIPHIGSFNNILGLDENEFVKKTQATFKLGIKFNNWGQVGESYIHPFGDLGSDMPNGVPFHHYWLKLFQSNNEDLFHYSMEVQACKQGKFSRPLSIKNSPLARIAYAFHLDAGLYAAYLRKFSENHGVHRIEGKIVSVQLREDTGFIQSVILENSQSIEGDLFIDCSGFRGLLIEESLNTGYIDWSHLLPCDRAVTVASQSSCELLPYTQATAQTAGWQWRIPLQHRTGNGHVYCSQYMSEDEATATLLNNLDGDAISEPKTLAFNTGRRKKFWNKNCVALGLSGGFMEPLESTSIYLIQSGISKLLALFPDKSFSAANSDKYNQLLALEYERIRDFLILHYWANQRSDEQFWSACQQIPIPNYLAEKVRLYKESGRIYRQDDELFSTSSWLAVFHGQNIMADSYHPLVDTHDLGSIQKDLSHIRKTLERCASSMPSHNQFIMKNCASEK